MTFPEFSDRDAACLVLPDLDYESQLAAIKDLLKRNKETDRSLTEEIKRLEGVIKRTSGLRGECAESEWKDRVHSSVYYNAAHSMAAVGMLAPLIESIFYQGFQGIRQRFHKEAAPPSEHERWQPPSEQQWDCHFVWRGGHFHRDLTAGIIQLAEAVGLDLLHRPNDLKGMLLALFGYRNKMFHCGFEWPVDERKSFQRRLSATGWPEDWFDQATEDDKPWIFYMSGTFIDHCVKTIEEVITGIGAFCKDKSGIKAGIKA